MLNADLSERPDVQMKHRNYDINGFSSTKNAIRNDSGRRAMNAGSDFIKLEGIL